MSAKLEAAFSRAGRDPLRGGEEFSGEFAAAGGNGARALNFIKRSARGAPIPPQRHVPNSIATIHRMLVVALATTLWRCQRCLPLAAQSEASL
jgi:hypothetical protein